MHVLRPPSHNHMLTYSLAHPPTFPLSHSLTHSSLDLGLIPVLRLLSQLGAASQKTETKRTLYAVSALCRQHQDGLEAFTQLDGFDSLAKVAPPPPTGRGRALIGKAEKRLGGQTRRQHEEPTRSNRESLRGGVFVFFVFRFFGWV